MVKTKGIDLRVERVRIGATQREVGRHMGVSAARVSVIERDKGPIDPDMAGRFRRALANIQSERKLNRPTSRGLHVVESKAPTQIQYMDAKAEARSLIKAEPWVRTVDLVINDDTPAAQLLGWIDGLTISGVDARILDSAGTMVNRRTG